MIQNVNNVTFNQNTRFTKKGNPYQKTKAVTWAGAGVGAACGLAKNAKTIFNAKNLINEVKDMLPHISEQMASFLRSVSPDDPSVDDFLNSTKYKKIINGIPKAGLVAVIGISIAGATIAGLIIGGIANSIVNKVRAHKADKIPQETQTAQPQPTQKTTTLNIKPPF